MRTALSAMAIVMAAFASTVPSFAAEVEVISGDTIRVGQNEWRIANIDAPSIEGRCKGERRLGHIAQAKLAEILAQGDLEITPTGGHDQHDRPTARVRLNGEDVGDKMVAASLAQRHGAARDLCPQSGYMDAWENQDEMNRVNRAHFGR